MTTSGEVVVYYRPRCPFAARLRVGLTLARIPYRAQRFRDDEESAARVREFNGGDEISPTVLAGARYLTNPSVREIRESLAAR